jgi:hypothetical protein
MMVSCQEPSGRFTLIHWKHDQSKFRSIQIIVATLPYYSGTSTLLSCHVFLLPYILVYMASTMLFTHYYSVTRGPYPIQGVPELVIQKSAVITAELEVTIWSGMFQKLRPVLKFSFKPPDGIPLVYSCL